MPRSSPYRLFFYQTARGERPVRVFLRSLSRKEFKKCRYYLNRLREEGTNLPTNIVEKIDANLWEAKPEWSGVEFRFLFGMIEGSDFGVVTALKKKRQRLPRSVFTHAMGLIEEMQEDRRRSNESEQS